MRIKKAGMATKLVVLILLLAVSLALLSVRTQLQTAQEEFAQLEKQERSLTEVIAGLTEDIANRDDPDKIADIAREKLNMAGLGERIFAGPGK
jgi:cell division protein FtsB